MDDKYNENKIKIQYIPILKDFKEIFLKEVPGLRLKRDIDIITDLISRALPASKYPYQMNIIELT